MRKVWGIVNCPAGNVRQAWECGSGAGGEFLVRFGTLNICIWLCSYNDSKVIKCKPTRTVGTREKTIAYRRRQKKIWKMNSSWMSINWLSKENKSCPGSGWRSFQEGSQFAIKNRNNKTGNTEKLEAAGNAEADRMELGWKHEDELKVWFLSPSPWSQMAFSPPLSKMQAGFRASASSSKHWSWYACKITVLEASEVKM